MIARAVYSLISLCRGTGNSKSPSPKIVWLAPLPDLFKLEPVRLGGPADSREQVTTLHRVSLDP